ncbi:CAP domain-containing protein [Corynebacterium phocae]|nr:CAP domain-containing protein [Corynebacterium phocae]
MSLLSPGQQAPVPAPAPAPAPAPNRAPAPAPAPQRTPDLKGAAVRSLDKINAERRRLGLVPLQWDEVKYSEALRGSQHVSRTGHFGHNKSGYYYWHLGENLAAGPNPEALVDMWLNEKYKPAGQRGHYDSLMHPSHRYYGMGITSMDRYGYVGTAVLSDRPGPAPAWRR